jgi:hypothetical protein
MVQTRHVGNGMVEGALDLAWSYCETDIVLCIVVKGIV